MKPLLPETWHPSLRSKFKRQIMIITSVVYKCELTHDSEISHIIAHTTELCDGGLGRD
jgi:hypothetical protein